MTAALWNWRRSYLFLLLATLLAVSAADFLFYEHALGWSIAIFAAVILFILTLRNDDFLNSTAGRVVVIATFGLILALIEQPTWFNVTYAIVCIGVLAIMNDVGWRGDFAGWVRRWGQMIARSGPRFFTDNGLAIRWMVRHGVPPIIARRITIWFVPLLLSSVFIALFAWANPIISDWLAQLGNWSVTVLQKLPEWISFPRLLFWLAFALFAWMLLRARARRWPVGEVVAPPPLPSASFNISPDLVIRCLLLFNIVFLVENALDVRYLWGAGDVHRDVYREIVRRGAYPLIAAALLAGAFVLLTFRPGSPTERLLWARRLVYLWIGQTIFLTGTAVYRLARYVEMSELTRLRVASTIWFLLVAMGLFYIIWRIVRGRSNAWLMNVNAVTALIVLYPCCFLNFDGMIAGYNVRHCQEAGGQGIPVDIEYFRVLGPAALPALVSIEDRIPYPPRRELAQCIERDLRAQLAMNLNDWRGWTWRRHRIAHEDQRAVLARARRQAYPAPAAVARTFGRGRVEHDKDASDVALAAQNVAPQP